jgi:hypothetical protein
MKTSHLLPERSLETYLTAILQMGCPPDNVGPHPPPLSLSFLSRPLFATSALFSTRVPTSQAHYFSHTLLVPLPSTRLLYVLPRDQIFALAALFRAEANYPSIDSYWFSIV